MCSSSVVQKSSIFETRICLMRLSHQNTCGWNKVSSLLWLSREENFVQTLPKLAQTFYWEPSILLVHWIIATLTWRNLVTGQVNQLGQFLFSSFHTHEQTKADSLDPVHILVKLADCERNGLPLLHSPCSFKRTQDYFQTSVHFQSVLISSVDRLWSCSWWSVVGRNGNGFL